MLGNLLLSSRREERHCHNSANSLAWVYINVLFMHHIVFWHLGQWGCYRVSVFLSWDAGLIHTPWWNICVLPTLSWEKHLMQGCCLRGSNLLTLEDLWNIFLIYRSLNLVYDEWEYYILNLTHLLLCLVLNSNLLNVFSAKSILHWYSVGISSGMFRS